ncbi:MAG TPA: NAD(P)H-hydrate dehydratase [Candidatus Bathyarchaeia archaeon]|nr:NAD(P)H-hydrate dehydratase [Candidatus Bathyarchaeia archaeon]
MDWDKSKYISEELAQRVDVGDIKALYKPAKQSYKGENGKLLIIGGSRLFHGASLWAVKIASRIVDLVYYCSIPENLKIAHKALLFDFIAVPKNQVHAYLKKSEAVLIGPGLEKNATTKNLTEQLLAQHPNQCWIIDACSLQTINKRALNQKQVITPHLGEFVNLFNPAKEEIEILKSTQNNHKSASFNYQKNKRRAKLVQKYSKQYGCVILLKGPIDIITSPTEWKYNITGNEGMTKGGTGDVLAGLVASLACENDLFLAACAGAYINGLAGDSLKKKVGIYFNTSDLCDEIPRVLKKLLILKKIN